MVGYTLKAIVSAVARTFSSSGRHLRGERHKADFGGGVGYGDIRPKMKEVSKFPLEKARKN